MKLSASQMNAFVKSPLDWCMVYLEGFRDAQSSAQLLGEQVHALVGYKLNGIKFETEDVDVNLLANMMIANIEGDPELGIEGWTNEHYFDFAMEGFNYRGYVDLFRRYNGEGMPQIYDIKITSSNLKTKVSYALNEEHLSDDYQLGLYLLALRSEGLITSFPVEIGQLQLIRKKLFGKVKDVEYRRIHTFIDQTKATEIYFRIVNLSHRIQEVANAWGRDGVDGVQGVMGKPLEELSSPKAWGRVNPFWDFYKGKTNKEDLRRKFDVFKGENK